MSRAAYFRAMAEAHRALAKALALEPERGAEAIKLDVDRETLIADWYDHWAAAEPAEIPTDLNTDTPPPIAPRDMDAEAREANLRG